MQSAPFLLYDKPLAIFYGQLLETICSGEQGSPLQYIIKHSV